MASARRRPTIVDVATAAGVSIKTVSRVINHVPTVDPVRSARVVAAVTKLGYRRNEMARHLRSGTSSASVGILIEDLTNPFYSTITAAVAEVAVEHDAMVLTASSEADAGREERLLLAMIERRVDGLLVVPTGGKHAYLQPAMAMGMPVVCIDRPIPGLATDSVVIDNSRGARSAVDDLVARGHTRIGILAESAQIPTMRARMTAARAALVRAGLRIDETLIRDGLHDPAAARAAVADMLGGKDAPTAFFCANNRTTIGALHEVIEQGSDAAISGFDDFETAPVMPRPLTLVSYDTRAIGRRSAELLFARMAGESGRRRRVVIPTKLVRRGRNW